MQHLKNIYHLGVKELIELLRDKCMMILIFYAFTIAIYVSGVGTPDAVVKAPIGVVDEDKSQLSNRITEAILPPVFQNPERIPLQKVDPGLDIGDYTYVLVIPSNFQKDVLTGKMPEIQLNVDATRMTQAFVGAGYLQQIVNMEIDRFINRNNGGTVQQLKSLEKTFGGTISADDKGTYFVRNQSAVSIFEPARLDLRDKFNPNLINTWFGGVNQLANMVTMLAIVLIGAALIRERERGTLEHLLVMPVTPFEIMTAKIWAMLVVVLIASFISVAVILQGFLAMPIDGSLLLYMVGIAIHLFAVTSMGIFLACIAQNMPQMGMLLILVLLPMNMLSGGQTPRESMPQWVQDLMQAAPTTHFVEFSQQILFRGAGIDVVWKPYLILFIIGILLFLYSLRKFRRTATA